MLDNDIRDHEFFTAGSIRETREQVNENTRRLDAMEQRLTALEPQTEPESEPEQEPEPDPDDEPDQWDGDEQ